MIDENVSVPLSIKIDPHAKRKVGHKPMDKGSYMGYTGKNRERKKNRLVTCLSYPQKRIKKALQLQPIKKITRIGDENMYPHTIAR